MKTKPRPTGLSDNSLAKKALEEIHNIEKEAKVKKMAQVDSLNSAKAAILERLNELRHQLTQIDEAIAKITGKPMPTRTTDEAAERKPRRDLSEVRVRVLRWMEGRKGEKFASGDLVREFTELEGVPVSIFLKAHIDSGKIKTDASEGSRRLKYFIEG